MDFHEPHSSVQVEAEQLLQHNIMLLRKEVADQLQTERARGAMVLSAKVVLFLAGYFGFDGHHLRREQIIVVALVQLRWILQVHLEDETLFFSRLSSDD